MLSVGRKILVVDDDESVRELCREVLDIAGYQVEAAEHALDGLDRLAGSSYDLVLSDMNMPELDGMDFYRMAVRQSPGLRGRFLFMTGGSLAGGRRLELLDLRLGCLQKPFRISELLAAVDALMSAPLERAVEGSGGLRAEGRLSATGALVLVAGGVEAAAQMRDISQRGARAKYLGLPHESGSKVVARLDMGLRIERRAEVRWSERDGSWSVSGLAFEEPVSAATILNISTFGRPLRLARPPGEGGVGPPQGR